MESVVEIADERHKASFAFFPDGMDPDEYIRAHGAEKFHDFVSKGMPLSKFIIQHFSSLNDMEVAEGRAKFVVDAMDLVSKIKAPILRHIVADEVRKTVGYHIPLGGLNIPLAQPVEPAPTPAPAPAPRRGFPTLGNDDEAQKPRVPTSSRPMSPSYGMRVLALLLEDPEAARNFDPKWIQAQPTTDEEMRAVTAVVDRVRSVRSEVTPDFIRNQFKDSEFAPLLQQATDTISQDQYAEMHELLNYVQYQQARMEVFKATIRKNLPKPT
jgi:DNA primase